MLLLRAFAVATLLLAGADAAFYGKKSAVIQLDHKNFGNEILNSENAAMVEFYAPWCGHCQNLKPAYEKAATSLKGIAKVAAIDCDEEKNKRTCGDYGVQGFPTLKLVVPSGSKGKPIVQDYQGARTAKAIADAVTERIPNHVTKLTTAKFDDFLSKQNETAKAILFTNKGTTGALWKSLAIDFKDAITFAQIRDKETEAVEKFGVTKFPTIVLLPGGGAAGKVYEGKMEKQALFDFFAAVKPPKSTEKEKPKESSSSPSSASSTAPKPTEKPKAEVPVLTGLTELQSTCFAKKSKTCVIALADAPLDSVTEAYAKLATRPPPHTFQVFRVDSTDEISKALVEKLELGSGLPQLMALHHRGWFRQFSGDVAKPADILAWLDAVKMGEGKKGKIPEALMATEEEKKETSPPPPPVEEKVEEKPKETKEDVKDEL